MEQNELISYVCGELAKLGVAHYLTGSIASGIYGESRTTNDVDIVADLEPGHVDPLLAAFPSDRFYVSREAAAHAVSSHGQFNIVDTDSFIKVDVFIPSRSPEARIRLGRRVERSIAPGIRVPIASPEDVIVMKLVYHKEGGSDRQLRDVVGILQNDRLALDHEYLKSAVASMDVAEVWDRVLHRAREGDAP